MYGQHFFLNNTRSAFLKTDEDFCSNIWKAHNQETKKLVLRFQNTIYSVGVDLEISLAEASRNYLEASAKFHLL